MTSRACSPVSSSTLPESAWPSPTRSPTWGSTWRGYERTRSCRRALLWLRGCCAGARENLISIPSGCVGWRTPSIASANGRASPAYGRCPSACSPTSTSHTGIRSGDRVPPWVPGAELEHKPTAELVDIAQAALEDEVRADATFPASSLFADLTGGKDSRLNLAVALTSGVADQLVFRTDGPADLLDVSIARELAAAVGVRWMGSEELAAFRRDVRTQAGPSVRPTATATPWAERMRRYVATTAGICNISDTVGRSDSSWGETRINGLCGELLRSTLSFEVPDEPTLVHCFDRHFGHLDLLRPEALAQFRNEWIVDLLDGRGARGSFNDRHDAFLLRTQVRSNFGPRLELSPEPRLMPLSCLAAVRVAYALGGSGRSIEHIHRSLSRRASSVLENQRFAKSGWHSLRPAPGWAKTSAPIRRWRRGSDRYPMRLDHPPAKQPLRKEASLNLADYRRVVHGRSDRMALVFELLSDGANPVMGPDRPRRGRRCCEPLRRARSTRPGRAHGRDHRGVVAGRRAGPESRRSHLARASARTPPARRRLSTARSAGFTTSTEFCQGASRAPDLTATRVAQTPHRYAGSDPCRSGVPGAGILGEQRPRHQVGAPALERLEAAQHTLTGEPAVGRDSL